jgi:hypothetical protein
MLPPRIMYIENKSAQPPGQSGVSGPGKSLYYKGKTFRSLKGHGFKANYLDIETGDHYWISGPRKDGADGLYGHRPTPIDDDVREEYWTLIRKRPSRKTQKTT